MVSTEKVLKGLRILKQVNILPDVLSAIYFDSRKVTQGALFIAVKGVGSDGHQFINAAIESGAACIVCEVLPELTPLEICFIQVADSSIALAEMASNFYDNPSAKLHLVGVTGTNGKTTTATLLYKLFESIGRNSGLLSTVCIYVHNEQYEATHTTPDPITINYFMALMVEAECDYCFMEVSSHASDQNRIHALQFAGGIFTNLTHDHLDYHKTFENYRDAKKKFFDSLPRDAFALTNSDDRNGQVMLQNTKAKKYTYSLQAMGDYKTRIIESHFDGTLININGVEAWIQLVGVFNAYNASAIFGAAVLSGVDSQTALMALSQLKEVRGRFEVLRSSLLRTAIIDYAHTPDAVENVLKTIHEVKSDNAAIITVIGCGGNRDKKKRPVMAKTAVNYSNKVILTSDNPRNEDPNEIIIEMEAGLDVNEKLKSLSIVDRAMAIKTAFMISEPGDVILIAGKGHETYQEIKGVKHHFDDREELLKLIHNY